MASQPLMTASPVFHSVRRRFSLIGDTPYFSVIQLRVRERAAERERDARAASLTPGKLPDQCRRDSAIGPELKLIVVADSMPVDAKDGIDPYNRCIKALVVRLGEVPAAYALPAAGQLLGQ